MSDEGEKTCPLCAEEMDLTDQQLKPCKCGYEICVWCWHHIMDMAEKDETEGRCPACRTPYNKEKIVGMAASCGRLVAEMNTERKKSQKVKGKTSEGRKQLGSVRVIQRNLVYIVGLPLNLADEDLLQRKEYFGQYGKVLKVSISRTAVGAIQHFANNTCSVYITYSKEDEAVRCIQSVHGFVLEGRSLRACFGTTKYCHAWLRNVPCTNPDCLYLHEIGSQEDSFTKDEIISAYTRSRVQQITGATNNMQRRSGNVLPPPADEYCNNSSTSSGKPVSKSATNNSASSARGSPPNSSSGISVALPAAASWGMRASNNQSPGNLVCSNGPSKQKPDTCNGPVAFSTAVASPTQVSILHGDIGKKPISNEESSMTQQKVKSEAVEPVKQYIGMDRQMTTSETPATPGLPATSTVNNQLYCAPAPEYKDRCTTMPPATMNSLDLSGQSCGPDQAKDPNVTIDGMMSNLCSDISSVSIDRHQGLQECYTEQLREPLTLLSSGKAVTSNADITRKLADLRSESQTQLPQVPICELDEDFLSFDDQRWKDPLHNSSLSLHLLNTSRGYSPQVNEACRLLNVNIDHQSVDEKVDKGSHPSSISIVSNVLPENRVGGSADLDRFLEDPYLLPNEGKGKHVGGLHGEVGNVNCSAALDVGESSIISNILSMDFDPWDESLTSPQNLVKLLGETDKQQGPLKVSSSWKVQNSNQSRFSFAREESTDQVYVDQSFSNVGRALKNHPLGHDFVDSRDMYLDKLGNCNGFSPFNVEESDNFTSSHSHISSGRLSVSRAQISAPPGFSAPSRLPPPGFSSQERMEQTFDRQSGNHSLDSFSLSRTPYRAPSAGNLSRSGDIEFMDPAILAVGKGRLLGGFNSPGLDMRSNFSPQLSTLENDARIQLLMQRSLSPHQNQKFSEMGDSFSPISDASGIPSRIMDPVTLANNLSPFSQLNLPQSRSTLMSNGHWDGWNEAQNGNDSSMAELLRSERLGFNKFYTGYEDSKLRMPSSGDLYNRTFGI